MKMKTSLDWSCSAYSTVEFKRFRYVQFKQFGFTHSVHQYYILIKRRIRRKGCTQMKEVRKIRMVCLDAGSREQ